LIGSQKNLNILATVANATVKGIKNSINCGSKTCVNGGEM
jgi:hypothetical protein